MELKGALASKQPGHPRIEFIDLMVETDFDRDLEEQFPGLSIERGGEGAMTLMYPGQDVDWAGTTQITRLLKWAVETRQPDVQIRIKFSKAKENLHEWEFADIPIKEVREVLSRHCDKRMLSARGRLLEALLEYTRTCEKLAKSRDDVKNFLVKAIMQTKQAYE